MVIIITWEIMQQVEQVEQVGKVEQVGFMNHQNKVFLVIQEQIDLVIAYFTINQLEKNFLGLKILNLIIQ